MQSHMIGMQATLDRILAAVSGGPPPQLAYPSGLPHGHVAQPSPGVEFGQRPLSPRVQFPPVPGFPPPVRENTPPGRGSLIRSQPHKYGSYGVVPSETPSDDESDSEGAHPRSALNPPIEALQGLANAAVEAANAPELSPRYCVYISSASGFSQLQ